jgi:hypothetical protein
MVVEDNNCSREDMMVLEKELYARFALSCNVFYSEP